MRTSDSFKPSDPKRFETALSRFDEENARDPNVEDADGAAQPRELVYSRWLTDWVLKLCPEASEELRLAARCQHICRWMVPRASYPMTRAGYLKWREGLKRFHARKSAEILHKAGYSEDSIARVRALNLKKDFPDDPECRVLAAALCLVFLERQFATLAAKTADDKIITALQKAWKKMTPAARTLAATLSYGPREKALLDTALTHRPESGE